MGLPREVPKFLEELRLESGRHQWNRRRIVFEQQLPVPQTVAKDVESSSKQVVLLTRNCLLPIGQPSLSYLSPLVMRNQPILLPLVTSFIIIILIILVHSVADIVVSLTPLFVTHTLHNRKETGETTIVQQDALQIIRPICIEGMKGQF